MHYATRLHCHGSQRHRAGGTCCAGRMVSMSSQQTRVILPYYDYFLSDPAYQRPTSLPQIPRNPTHPALYTSPYHPSTPHHPRTPPHHAHKARQRRRGAEIAHCITWLTSAMTARCAANRDARRARVQPLQAAPAIPRRLHRQRMSCGAPCACLLQPIFLPAPYLPILLYHPEQR